MSTNLQGMYLPPKVYLLYQAQLCVCVWLTLSLRQWVLSTISQKNVAIVAIYNVRYIRIYTYFIYLSAYLVYVHCREYMQYISISYQHCILTTCLSCDSLSSSILSISQHLLSQHENKPIASWGRGQSNVNVGGIKCYSNKSISSKDISICKEWWWWQRDGTVDNYQLEQCCSWQKESSSKLSC